MVPGHGAPQSGLDGPFLSQQRLAERAERDRTIRDEVTAYLDAARALQVYEQTYGQFGLRGVEKPEVPRIPPCLDWLAKIERWGLPNPGTWLDQPKDFWRDIEQARLARDTWEPKKTADDQHRDFNQIFADKPPPAPVV